jgi:threonine dehydrogenase-like Zn-dependent dehydrogenase
VLPPRRACLQTSDNEKAITMDAQLMAVLAAGVGVVMGAGVVGLMARGKLKAAALRSQQLEQHRLQAAQQTSAARRQIEALQKEVQELRQLMAHSGVAAPARKNVSLEGLQDIKLDDEKETHGFAATQVIARGDR